MTVSGHASALFGALQAGYERAASGNEITRQFRFAGHVIEFRYACAALDEALTTAMLHAEVDRHRDPDLSIRLWESASSGVEAPPMPWGPDDRALISERSESIPRLYYDDGRHRFISTHRSNLLAYEPGARQSVFWLENVDCLMQWERAAPMRLLLQMYFADGDVELVHAAAVGHADGAVLLTGPSGSGKSTTSLLCLNSGFDFCSDDYCALDDAEPARVHSLYSSAKLLPESVGMINRFRPEQIQYDSRDSPKAVIYLARELPERVLRTAPVRAVVACGVSGGARSVLSPVGGGVVLRALAPSSLLQGPGDKQRSLSFMAALVRRCPTYTLELGLDLRRIPDLISSILETMGE